MAKIGKMSGLMRLQRVLGFFIGIFGALAILGVFFKIMKWPNYETFMIIGFIGEASAFVTMGIFELISAIQGKDATEQGTGGAVEVAHTADAEPRILAFRQQLDESLQAQVGEVMEVLTGQIRRFGFEMQELGVEMERSRRAVQNMRSELDKVATGTLASDAEELGRGMKRLGGEMAGAGNSVERIRSDLDEMARRFQSFNEPSDSEWQENKIKRLS